MRRLLPYEHALIDTLGITEEEYFAFRKAQQEYRDPKVGTIFDTRNGIEVVALVLSIVGTIAQVAAALLAPRPEAPEAQVGRQRRERRFSPRYGFDSLQELTQYGEPCNLVYTNQGTGSNDNPNGGVRVSTSLLWSAVYSNGNAQYIQMLAAIGGIDAAKGGNIVEIDPQRTAVGSTLLRLFIGNVAWLYFKNGGPILTGNKISGNGRDPFVDFTQPSQKVYSPRLTKTNVTDGFSQAFSPASVSEFGITAPVPINVNVYARDDEGKLNKKQNVGIKIASRGNFWRGDNGSEGFIAIGERINLSIDKVKENRGSDEADNFADEIRMASTGSFELGGVYKLGSAKFQVVDINGDSELDRAGNTVILECIEAGRGPFSGYDIQDVNDQKERLEAERDTAKNELSIATTSRANLKESDYATSNLTDKQLKMFRDIEGFVNRIEDICEAISTTQTDYSQLDDLVLRDPSVYDSTIVSLANDIDGLEIAIENDRDRIDNFNLQIADTNDEDKRNELRGKRNQVRAAVRANKVTLRTARMKLNKRLEQNGVKNGVVHDFIGEANGLIKQARAVFEQATGKEALDFETFDRSTTNKKARASNERKQFRIIRARMRRLENEVASLAQVDFTAFNQEASRLDALIATLNKQIAGYNQQLSNPEAWNDYLGIKCLVKHNEAKYATLSAVHAVHFSIKAKVFMRVQGRASKYGETEAKGYKESDNGYKPRTSMFMVYYREMGQTDAEWKSPNVIFCVRRRYDKDNFIPLIFKDPSGTGDKKWEFRFDPIIDAPSEAKKKGTALQFVYLEARGQQQNVGGIFYYYGYSRNGRLNNLPAKNDCPNGIDEWTLFSSYSDTNIQFSFDGATELKIATVTEQQYIDYALFPNIYKNVATIGFNAYSTAGLTNVRNLSVYVKKGKKVRNIELAPPSYPSSPNAPSCWAPDIFLDTLLDRVNGIGEYVDTTAIDVDSLAVAKSFCMKQKYYMDGIIADRTSWRSFWSEVAPYSLLELARIGGKETLIPAVPVLGDGTITRNITISALFNQGNILEDSYREEFLDYGEATEDAIITVVYRDQPPSEPFPRNTSVTVSLADTNEATASRRTFDLSAFVTNRNQAINYAMLLCQQRRHVRRAVEFKTFPTEAPVRPGSYIYVQIEDNQWNNIHSGAVMDDGSLNIPFGGESINGTFDTLIYQPGRPIVKQSIAYTNGQSATLGNTYKGTGALFVLGNQVSAKRVFRVTEVAMEEEGEVTIKATEHPCIEESGQTKSLIVRFGPALYKIV